MNTSTCIQHYIYRIYLKKKTIIKFSLISFMQQQTTTLTIVIPGDYRD